MPMGPLILLFAHVYYIQAYILEEEQSHPWDLEWIKSGVEYHKLTSVVWSFKLFLAPRCSSLCNIAI